jgi:hypothetical protein
MAIQETKSILYIYPTFTTGWYSSKLLAEIILLNRISKWVRKTRSLSTARVSNMDVEQGKIANGIAWFLAHVFCFACNICYKVFNIFRNLPSWPGISGPRTSEKTFPLVTVINNRVTETANMLMKLLWCYN